MRESGATGLGLARECDGSGTWTGRMDRSGGRSGAGANAVAVATRASEIGDIE